MPETIYDARWEDLLPEELKQDPRISAMVTAIAEEKRRIAREIWRVRLWPDFQGVPEKIMEELRKDFDLSTFEFQGTVEEKQRILSMARALRKNAGTVSAVKNAIATVYPDGNGDVLEWFKYGGEPYYFQPVIDVTGAPVTEEILDLTMARINQAKNVRSWIDRIKLTTDGSQSGTVYTGGVIRRRRDAEIRGISGGISEIPYLTDEDSIPLADETGMVLIEG